MKKTHTQEYILIYYIFIEGEDRLKTWENHFKNLLNVDVDAQPVLPPIQKIFDHFLKLNVVI